ncbi:MAG: ribbon-helix-helix domain-containing protein [Pseudomonadota bacterium]
MNLKFSQTTEEAISRLNPGGLISRNIRIGGKRTSIRLESEMWQALHEIAALESCSIHDLCTAVNDIKENGTSFTAALRVFLMQYYRTVAMTDFRIDLVRQKIRA